MKNAPILVLDEATASLDMKSEEQIQKEIERLASGRTTFIIAHRFSTIRMADRILVLEKGRVVADGTHEELMANSEIYREVYESQTRGKAADVPAEEDIPAKNDVSAKDNVPAKNDKEGGVR